jgi:hypothetical protein
VKHAHLERKSLSSLAMFTVPSPPILDDIDEHVRQAILNTKPSLPPSFPVTLTTTHRHENTTALPHLGKFGPWVVMSNIESTIPSASVEEEFRHCFVAIQGASEYFSRSRKLRNCRLPGGAWLRPHSHSQYHTSHFIHGAVPRCQRYICFLFWR